MPKTKDGVCLMFHGINSTGQISIDLKTGTRIIEEILKDESVKLQITFDDAYQNIEPALELWSRYDIPIRIFVPTGLIGKQLANSKVAEVQQLKYWNILQNVALASHAHSHVNLTRLSRQQRIEELLESKRIVEEITGDNCYEIAYPRGRYNLEVLEDVFMSGYRFGWTTRQGTVPPLSSTNLELPRFAIHDYTTPREIAGRISKLSLFIESRIIQK